MKKHKVDLSPKAPRGIEELKKFAGEITFRLGNNQYEQERLRREGQALLEALGDINEEAAARNELDAKESK